MIIVHEEEARKVYADAHNFVPVYRGLLGLNRKIIGWVFQIKADGSAAEKWSWITLYNQVSNDPQSSSFNAQKRLTSYVGNQRRIDRIQSYIDASADTNGDSQNKGT
jgi:hypothetical protein